jgi:hypothetical protein
VGAKGPRRLEGRLPLYRCPRQRRYPAGGRVAGAAAPNGRGPGRHLGISHLFACCSPSCPNAWGAEPETLLGLTSWQGGFTTFRGSRLTCAV